MTGKLVALTGPAGCGKDTLARTLTGTIQREYPAQLTSGSAVFRSVALWAYQQGHDPQQQLPEDVFSSVELSLREEGVVEIIHDGRRTTYTPEQYTLPDVGMLGSDFAVHSAAVYKGFAIAAIRRQVTANSQTETHSVLGTRDSFRIAAEIPDVSSLSVYLAVTEETQRQRLRGRLAGKSDIDSLIEAELQRDRQDIASGTLPCDDDRYPDLSGDVRSGIPYMLKNDSLTAQQATHALYTAFLKLGP
ncbi:hypothetical protein COV20_00355 [Candidatus Woesearchaeota archaeon CG10_big_fil_rev_8_21_14_0_10_45_16]|nr:MAG: hypothetical protein COV20_00355 [Candidatus Woesearchaeota archaeon CG10_big_fil_rev_8_21_14_0_10_45_16]